MRGIYSLPHSVQRRVDIIIVGLGLSSKLHTEFESNHLYLRFAFSTDLIRGHLIFREIATLFQPPPLKI